MILGPIEEPEPMRDCCCTFFHEPHDEDCNANTTEHEKREGTV